MAGMTVSEFTRIVNDIAKEIGCTGTEIASHKLKSHILIDCENKDDNHHYELVGIDADRLPGCGCWDGIVFVIKKVKD